ncbi:biotin transporter BioY [Paenibacillus sp. YYML68]|uniref:biotin transporter BioY n=1 Tax=Paenibacillus sp. YYML68 TaxID=2909250 RepID=UPI0024935C5B|nr:biotin transporter BioY [Paenibacillus sp. YYML68]
MNIKDMVYAAIMAAVVAVLGLIPAIPIPYIPVPITVQTLGVMLAGSLIGARLGGISMLLVVILVAFGAPILSGGRGGMGIITGATGGYLLSWPLAAFVIGVLVHRYARDLKVWKLILINIVGGILVVYAIGIPYSALITKAPLAKLMLGNLTFIPGDLIKAVVASLLAARIHRAMPQLLRRSGK